MSSPLKIYRQLAEEFGITKDKSLHIRQQIAYFSEQANQQRMIANRLLGDLAKARLDLQNAQDSIAKSAYKKKINDYENDLMQMSESLSFFIQMEKELNEENPTVQTTEADIPESD